ncbi:hypothetical protein AD998_07585 [bacterium 336/3]|nr:hypothetical protein AD998_07585 [bacterium 336/3]
MSKERKKALKALKTLEEQKLILEVHNSLEEGINLKVKRSNQKGFTDTPLFNQNQQTDLFTK